MRELEVLDRGHLKLDWEERKAFFEGGLDEQVRSEVKQFAGTSLGGRADHSARGGALRTGQRSPLRLPQRLLPEGSGNAVGADSRAAGSAGPARGEGASLLPRYQRRQECVHGLVREAFLRGISTRQVGEVLEPVLGEAYSAQTISRIARGLDAAVERFHRRRLRDDVVYLVLDGVVLKVRDARGKVRRRVVLVAYGITGGRAARGDWLSAGPGRK